MAEFVDALADLDISASRAIGAGADTVADAGAACDRRLGPLVVVSGPRGSGVTEVAVTLAAALAARRESVVLVDAHEVAPSVAGRLGLELEPNLRSAIDACAHGLGELPATITWPPGGAAALGVVAGFPSPVAATQVTPDDVLGVVDAVRAAPRRAWSTPTRRPRSRRCCSAPRRPSSVWRVRAPWGSCARSSGPHSVRRRVPATPVHLAVNRAPGARYRREEIRAEIVRTLRPESITWLPTDARVEAAAWDGALVGRGPFRAAVASLAHEVTCRSAATRWGRKA